MVGLESSSAVDGPALLEESHAVDLCLAEAELLALHCYYFGKHSNIQSQTVNSIFQSLCISLYHVAQ
jgi:hypothetical protein